MANTRPLKPPLVPEGVLHLAEESLPIWRKTEEELAEIGMPPPYWAFAWAGGQALARHLLDHRDLVAGKTVLDIGSGSGLVGIAAALAGADHVLAVDIDPFAIAATRLNAKANSATVDAALRDLLEQPAAELPEAEVVLLGDLFYEDALSRRALQTAQRFKARGAAVCVGDPQRWYFQADAFDKLAEYAVPVTRELEDNEIKRTAVWTLA